MLLTPSDRAEPEWPTGLQCRTCCMRYGQSWVQAPARTSTNACGHICKYVDQKGSTAMLPLCTVSRRCTRDESQVHTSEKAHKGSTLALKPMENVIRSPKQEYQWPHKKGLCPPKILRNSVRPRIHAGYCVLCLPLETQHPTCVGNATDCHEENLGQTSLKCPTKALVASAKIVKKYEGFQYFGRECTRNGIPNSWVYPHWFL